VIAKWRWYAARELPRVVLELGLRCATAGHADERCPVHHVPLGPVTCLCDPRFGAGRDAVARRYREHADPTQQDERRTS
jgi:hypothetical protein